jgi:hypothetical protein
MNNFTLVPLGKVPFYMKHETYKILEKVAMEDLMKKHKIYIGL